MDFSALTPEFFDEAVIVPGKIGRLIGIGRLELLHVTVIFTPFGTEAVSIISMRMASRKEARLL